MHYCLDLRGKIGISKNIRTIGNAPMMNWRHSADLRQNAGDVVGFLCS